MRQLDPDLDAHLKSGATTLCRCWTLERRDGARFGFTDHDVALFFDDVSYEPAAGFTGSEIPSSLGLNIDTAEITGALSSPLLNEADINAGLYDGAGVILNLVNWAAPQQRACLTRGMIGEITRTGKNFTAEVRSLSASLDQERGRLFQATCDADLGDLRCGVDLNAIGNSGSGTVDAVLGTRTFRVSGLAAIDAGRLQRGLLTVSTGAAAGLKFPIRTDRQTDEGRVIELWRAPAKALAAGDDFTASVGCDKTFATCAKRFGNAVNFRGFPHIPGTDFAMSYVSRDGDDNDGSALL